MKKKEKEPLICWLFTDEGVAKGGISRPPDCEESILIIN